MYEACRSRAAEVQPELAGELEAELALIEAEWPHDLPTGVIHADLFPDNVFFREREVSGLIDFYFACTDFLAYDLAICLNAWCFEADGSLNVTKARLLLEGYRRARPLSAAELAALPLLARGSALRFLLTRLFDWLNQPAGALVRPKDPARISAQAALPPRASPISRATGSMPELADVEIFTDGACRGNPGPGGWAAILRYREVEKELSGYDPADHQQPHGDDGGDRRARSAEAAVPGPALQRQPISARRHHQMDTRLEAARLADRRQAAGQECRSVAAARRRGGPARRRLGNGCAAMPATPKTSGPTRIARARIAEESWESSAPR